eukprot:3324824-Prymnesium_polylepis.1
MRWAAVGAGGAALTSSRASESTTATHARKAPFSVGASWPSQLSTPSDACSQPPYASNVTTSQRKTNGE